MTPTNRLSVAVLIIVLVSFTGARLSDRILSDDGNLPLQTHRGISQPAPSKETLLVKDPHSQ